MSLNEKREREEIKQSTIDNFFPIKKKKEDPIERDSNYFVNLSLESNCLNKTICQICRKDISQNIKILCNECENFFYCIECLVQLKHLNHSYHICDKLSFPFFTHDWSLNDELKLISSVSKCGLDNWGDICDNLTNRGNIECEAHYYTFYYKNKDEKYPNENYIILNDDKTINNKIKENNEKNENEVKDMKKKYPGKIPELPNQQEKNRKRNGRSVMRNYRSGNISGINSAAEILGYLPKRDELEIEFLNDAELPLAELEFLDEDTELDKKIKNDVLIAYNYELDERAEHKDFIIKKGLFDLKRQNSIECRLSKEDREILNFLKPFARFYDNSDFYDLFEGLVLEKNLKQKLYQLKNYQKIEKQGKHEKLTTLDDLKKYLEIDNKSKNKKKEKENNNELQIQSNTYSLLGERVKRFIHFNENINLNEFFDEKEKNFIKEMPLAKTTFADIKMKIQSHFNKNIPINKDNIDAGISDILLKYGLEKKTYEEIFNFYLKKLINEYNISTNDNTKTINENNSQK